MVIHVGNAAVHLWLRQEPDVVLLDVRAGDHLIRAVTQETKEPGVWEAALRVEHADWCHVKPVWTASWRGDRGEVAKQLVDSVIRQLDLFTPIHLLRP